MVAVMSPVTEEGEQILGVKAWTWSLATQRCYRESQGTDHGPNQMACHSESPYKPGHTALQHKDVTGKAKAQDMDQTR